MLKILTAAEQRQFKDELVLPIFAHKRTKGLPFLTRFKEADFEVVTSVCEGYSDEKARAYLKLPTLAFIFAWFSYASKEGHEFARKKFGKKEGIPKSLVELYIKLMTKGIKKFGSDSLTQLESDNSSLSKKLVKYMIDQKWKLD